MKIFFFEILVQTALTVGLFWTILKLTPKSALLSFTILYARVLGSVFRMKFRVLSREFESIETSPGFARLLGENWN